MQSASPEIGFLLAAIPGTGLRPALKPPKGPNISGVDYPISNFLGPMPNSTSWGWNVPIDKNARPVSPGHPIRTHTSLVQQFLNVSEDHLWGFVSNGHLLRVLRDNKTLAAAKVLSSSIWRRCSMGESFFGFRRSVFSSVTSPGWRPKKPHECYLEKWLQAAARNGNPGHWTNSGSASKKRLKKSVKDFWTNQPTRRCLNRFAERLLIKRGILPANTSLNLSDAVPVCSRKIAVCCIRLRPIRRTQELYRRYYSLGRIRELASKKSRHPAQRPMGRP